ncbi:MAG: ATP:cob(I)alamin adenosyltransferase, partial [Ilumatobacteraceae bacterium]|nr:ATP:cob(I)alamin adenosyltransferase [Ilumatobacteraceae bacterium]
MTRQPIYTRDGDDGTTGLFYGGRVPKDSELPRAYGTVDEAQAVLGLARSTAAGNTGDARSAE